MLDVIFIILLLFTIILMIYSIGERRIALCFLTAILWLIIALFCVQGIEIPYQIYNASANEIQTGLQTYQNNIIPLSYLFTAMAIIMFLVFITFLLEGFSDYRKIK